MRPERLHVFFGDEQVGTVHDATPLAFAYAPAWLTRADPLPVAAIPLHAGMQDGAAVQAFFENLLPEGELRRYLAEQRKASTLFSMLLEVAGDTVGGFVMLPEGQQPAPPAYEPTTWKKLAAALGKPAGAAIDIKGRDARISLAGAQDKTSIAIFADGIPRLPKGTAPSTHILKPDIRRLAKVWHSAANEAIVMRAAAHCGLPTAEVFYETQTQSCIVRRFDRVMRPDASLERLVQYDLCQLAGVVSEKKYEKEGGPGLLACADWIRRLSSQPAVDLRHLVEWVFFNLYVGNNDSHAKNLSVFRRPGQGLALTPFYDLMCTRLYPGLSREFAFAIGGETRPGAIGREHAQTMAEQLRMRPSFVLKLAAQLAARMPGAVGQAVQEMLPVLPPAARDLAGRLETFVLSTTKKMSARL
jgi:serine/threonine-protein kinase HipA